MTPIVTMGDIMYMPGIFTLLQSLEENGNLPDNQKIIIIEFQPFLKSDKDIIKRYPFDIQFIDIRDLGNPDDELTPGFKYVQDFIGVIWVRSFMYKTLIFKLYEYPKLVWIDADMLCLNDISEISKMKPTSAPPDLGENKEIKVNEFNKNVMFTTGFFVYEPSEKTYNEFIEYSRKYRDILFTIPPSGDQVLINGYFWNKHSDKVKILPRKWGVTWKIAKSFPKLYDKLMHDDPKFLHLVGDKPWLFQPGMCPDVMQRESVDLWWEYMGKAWEKM